MDVTAEKAPEKKAEVTPEPVEIVKVESVPKGKPSASVFLGRTMLCPEQWAYRKGSSFCP